MRRTLIVAAVFAIFYGVFSAQGRGLKADMAYNPGMNVDKVNAAELIVVGQVVGIEDKDLKVNQQPGSPLYRVAVVQVTETLKGKATSKLVRVGFQAPNEQLQPMPQPIGGFKKRPFPGNMNVVLTMGAEGLFYLKQQPGAKFHTFVQSYGSFVSSDNKEAFKGEVAQIKVTANPMKSLKAANAEDRSMAAIVLVKHYRQPIFIPGKGQQLQPLDAEESKLILKNLLEAQWPNPPQPINYQYNPAIAFNMLGLGPQDGFQNVPNGVYSQQYTDAAKAWLTKNWQTYRIQRYLGAANGVNGGTTPGESTPIKAPAFRR